MTDNLQLNLSSVLAEHAASNHVGDEVSKGMRVINSALKASAMELALDFESAEERAMALEIMHGISLSIDKAFKQVGHIQKIASPAFPPLTSR